jgi:DNA-3-methyladenine glycosylase I
VSSYCEAAARDPLHKAYHDTEYGFPIHADALLLERLALEINQAGLSWTTILKKKAAFRAAYEGFDPQIVAAYGDEDVARLLADAGIVRNRLKVAAVIDNARRVLELSGEYGSWAGWLDSHHPASLEEWTRLFKRTFRFTGGEIVREFLVSTGYLPGAHDRDCPVYETIARLNPPWLAAAGS